MELDLTGLVLPERVEAVHVSDDGRSGRFVIEPLERGFGHTLGNPLRRVLLSSLRGAAVWAFRVEGVVHEHQTMQGVVEDVHQVIQNLKGLVLRMDADVEEALLELHVRGPGVVTAGMIQGPSSVQVLDPEHHILTLEEERELRMELFVNKGRGFVLADQHPLPKGSPVDLVRIDSIYNPVRRANFTVEETRVGQRTDFDRLTLLVETNGAVTPEAAVGYAAELIRKHLAYMLAFGKEGARPTGPAGAIPVSERLRDLLRRPIDDLAELTVRSRNSLQKENIQTLEELIRRTEQEMLDIGNFGKKSLKEISDFLESQGLRFGLVLEEGEDGRLYLVPREVEKGGVVEGEMVEGRGKASKSETSGVGSDD